MSQKIQFISATIHDPDLFILDEPFSGLDPVNTRLLREQIHGGTPPKDDRYFSTHVMSQAEEICDRVVMIHRGQKCSTIPWSTILRPHDSRALKFELLERRRRRPARCVGSPEVERCTAADGGYEVELRAGVDADACDAGRAWRRFPSCASSSSGQRLEDVFLGIVAGDKRPCS